MEKLKVQRGMDGTFTLCFLNKERKSQREILEEVNQYGECISFKQIPNKRVFIRFKEEDEAQRCLDANPHMQLGFERRPVERNPPKLPGKMSGLKSRQGETKATEETHSENPKLQYESNEENAESPSRKCRSIDTSKDLQEQRKTHVNGTKQKVKTPNYRGKNGNVNGELSRPNGKLNSSKQPTSNLPDEMPPLINRASGRPPKKLAVDMIFANFPDDITQDDIANLVETLHPLKVGSILKTRWNEPYCHVYVTEEAAILAERDYNLALYGGYHLVVARARTLLAEAQNNP